MRRSPKRAELGRVLCVRAKAAVLALSLMMAVSGCFSPENTEVPLLLEPREGQSASVKVERGSLLSAEYLDVTSVPRTESLMLTVSGIMGRVEVKPGDLVKEGDLLLTLKQESLEEQIAAQESYLDSLQTEYYYANLAASHRTSAAASRQLLAEEKAGEASSAYEEAKKEESDAAKALLDAETAESDRLLQEAAREAAHESEAASRASERERLSAERADDASLTDESLLEEREASRVKEESRLTEEEAAAEEAASAERTKAQEEKAAYETNKQSLEQALSELTKTAEELRVLAEADLYAIQLAEIQARKAALSERQGRSSRYQRLSQQQEALEKDKEPLSEGSLYAPISGRVVKVSCYEGQWTESYTVLVVIADESSLRLKGSPMNNAVLKNFTRMDLLVGDKAYPITYMPYDDDEYVKRTLQGETLPSYFVLQEADAEAIGYGVSGTVRLYRGYKADCLYVPRACLSADEYGTYVYKEENGQRVKAYVTTGLQNAAYTEITDGLQEGDEIYENE